MLIARRSDLMVVGSLAVFLGGSVSVFSDRIVGSPWLGALIGGLVFLFGMRQSFWRWLAMRKPLPLASLSWLAEHVQFYRHLPAEGQEAYERDVRIALSELSFEGVAGARVTETLKLAVAAGAALLLHGRPDWDLPRGHTVLFYPGAFDDGFDLDTEGRIDGMVNLQGPLLLSVPAVEYGWKYEDGLNVVLHELAHLLDFQGSGANGLPALLAPASAKAWSRLVKEEIVKVNAGRSVLRPYAGTNAHELFAVAVEQFFERPERLQDGHPELFRALVALFNLNPTPTLPREALDETTSARPASVG